MAKTTNKTPDTTEVKEAEAPSLTLKDLGQLRNIIDVASQRGAFKPAEFTVVGETYTRLSNFIQAITPPESAQPAEEPAKEPSEVTGE